ncbi:MAG: hypothetical protein QOJ46_2078 [bacterium]
MDVPPLRPRALAHRRGEPGLPASYHLTGASTARFRSPDASFLADAFLPGDLRDLAIERHELTAGVPGSSHGVRIGQADGISVS